MGKTKIDYQRCVWTFPVRSELFWMLRRDLKRDYSRPLGSRLAWDPEWVAHGFVLNTVFFRVALYLRKKGRERESKNEISCSKVIFTLTPTSAQEKCLEIVRRWLVSDTEDTKNLKFHSRFTHSTARSISPSPQRRHKFTTTPGITIFSLLFFSLPLWVTQVLGSQTQNKKENVSDVIFLLSFQELFLVYFYELIYNYTKNEIKISEAKVSK